LFYGSAPPAHIDVPAGAPIREIVISAATFVFREDGTVASWGANPPLARVSSLNPDSHPQPIALTSVASIDVVGDSACATSDGTGYCWGSIDVFPSLELAPPANIHAMPEPVVAPEPLVQIATTRRNRIYTGLGPDIVEQQRWCGVGASGAVHCWGYNSTGQAGDGTKNYAFNAVAVAGLPGPAVEVKTMPLSTCALLTTGQIYCWGNNLYGQLGNGTIKGVSLVPEHVVLP
jgi:alpha-tubulin suppressor-like RCC1 family protein